MISIKNRIQEFWNRQPCNIRHSTSQIGTPEFFREVTARRYFVEPHILNFMEPKRWNKKYILEVGCGIGTDTEQLVRAGASVLTFDFSERAVELTTLRLASQAEAGNWWVFQHDAEQPIPSQYANWEFDLIYSFGTLHHTPNPKLALRQLRRVAGSYQKIRDQNPTELRIMLYHRWSTKTLGILVKTPPWRWKDAIAQHSEAQAGCPVTHTFTKRSAEQLLRQSGWIPTYMEYRHIFPYNIKEYKKYKYVKKLIWNLISPHWLEKWLGWHLLIVAKPDVLWDLQMTINRTRPYLQYRTIL